MKKMITLFFVYLLIGCASKTSQNSNNANCPIKMGIKTRWFESGSLWKVVAIMPFGSYWLGRMT